MNRTTFPKVACPVKLGKEGESDENTRNWSNSWYRQGDR